MQSLPVEKASIRRKAHGAPSLGTCGRKIGKHLYFAQQTGTTHAQNLGKMFHIEIGIYDILLNGADYFIHKFLIRFVHLHIIYREERTFRECLSLPSTVIE